ncbi:hypothetical protein [Plantactinospora endophytica]|uniref:DUF2970 domain-containing protein n=1 Tax=Plantactinospora endophytica TaxID=673535 RepID=A0ABQ4E3B4_9ACTN|nr:hypothetical protein [Plantactinospora endophytica]GIG88817.1 hypothetical protein Pen02_37530 [Plantactinospora endophytica]
MSIINYLHIALRVRLAELRRTGDRGDSPVPTAVIIFGLVAAALAVTVAVSRSVTDWMDAIPEPGGGADTGGDPGGVPQ